MPQNRNQLIELFIGNITNAIVHRILEKAIGKEVLALSRTVLSTARGMLRKKTLDIDRVREIMRGCGCPG